MSNISCCLLRGVPMVAEGVIYFICVQWHVSNIRLFHSLLLIILLPPPPWALRQPHRSRLCKGYSVNCFCSDISYIHYMSVSCPSGLCLSAFLPLVTSQAPLESDVLESQPGVTAGFAICSRLWVVRTGIQRSLLTSLNRLDFI